MRLTEAKGLIRYYGETEDLYSDENMAAAPADAPPTPVSGRAQARVWRLLQPLVSLSPSSSLIVECAWQVNTSAAETALAESRSESLAGGSTCPSEAGIASMIDLTAHAVRALEAGVVRAHVVPPVSGALLQELYTLDGAGTLADCTG